MEGTGGAGSSGMFESLTRNTASSSKPMKKFYKGEPMALGVSHKAHRKDHWEKAAIPQLCARADLV